jgi:iron complex transport system ATP-binding protein
MSEAVLLRANALAVSAGARLLVQDLAMTLHAGEMLAVLGRNGSGKSLLLHTLAGLRAWQSGQIELQGRPLASMARRDIAQRLGFLPQDAEPPPQVTVLEWVLGGRFAHGSEWRWPSPEDNSIAAQCLDRVQLGALAQRWLPTLSGGEQRRAALATLLAQAPVVMLLDEPTNHLDPRQISSVMQIARDACATGAAVIVTLHDPQLAARWADRALLLHGDGRWQLGAVADTLTSAVVSELYDTPFSSLQAGGRSLLLQL